MARRKKSAAEEQAAKGNYQDAAMDAEKAKGSKDQQQSKRGGNSRRGSGKRDSGKQSGQKGSLYSVGSRKGSNSPAWYYPTQQTAKDVTNIPLYIPLGRAIPMATVSNLNPSANTGTYVADLPTPGVMSLNFFQTLGEPGDAFSPINVAARSLYNAVRSANSRAATYTAEDLMLSIYAMTQPYLYLRFCQRALGILSYFNIMDRYTPRILVESMGIDYDDLTANKENFRTWLNMYALKISQFPIPQGIDFFDKVQEMVDNVYTDANSDKAQYYILNPLGFYTYSENYSDGARLTFSQFKYPQSYIGLTTSTKKVSALITYGDKLLNPLVLSEQTRDMCADLIKVFGSSLIQPQQISETFSITPTYSEEKSMQIENAIVAGIYEVSNVISKHTEINNSYIQQELKGRYLFTFASAASDISFKTATVATNPQPQNLNDKNVVLNFHGKNPTSDDILVATRFTNYPISESVQSTGAGPEKNSWVLMNNQHSTMVIASMTVFYYSNSGVSGLAAPVRNELTFGSNMLATVASDVTVLRNFTSVIQNTYLTQALVAAFDWAPRTRLGFMWTEPSGGVVAVRGIEASPYMMELDNWTMITQDQLDLMHTSAKMGLFYPKSLGVKDANPRDIK